MVIVSATYSGGGAGDGRRGGNSTNNEPLRVHRVAAVVPSQIPHSPLILCMLLHLGFKTDHKI